MADARPDPFWKFLTGLAVGIGLTSGYIRFGYQLPGAVQMPAKVTSAAISIAAQTDLENWELPLATRQRAAAVLLSQNPDKIIELDDHLQHSLLTTLLQQTAVRRAKLAKAKFDAYDELFSQPHLRTIYERKYKTSDPDVIKHQLLLNDVQQDDVLRGYLAAHWPEETLEDWAVRVLRVYENELQPPATMMIADDAPLTRR